MSREESPRTSPPSRLGCVEPDEHVASVLFVQAHIEFCEFMKSFQSETHSSLSRQLADAVQDRRKPAWRHSLFGEIMHLVNLTVNDLNSRTLLKPASFLAP